MNDEEDYFYVVRDLNTKDGALGGI